MKTFCKLTAQSPAASYVPLPRFLLQDEALLDISNDAKVLYAPLLDRASISRQNGYVEPDGTIRLYFTLEQAQTKLHRSRQSATRIFRELEYSGLIIRKKQGLGKPALITLIPPRQRRKHVTDILVQLGTHPGDLTLVHTGTLTTTVHQEPKQHTKPNQVLLGRVSQRSGSMGGIVDSCLVLLCSMTLPGPGSSR